MDLGGERMLVRCGEEERRIEPDKLEATVVEFRKLSPGVVVEVRRYGIVRG
jgi:hypothetical protein